MVGRVTFVLALIVTFSVNVLASNSDAPPRRPLIKTILNSCQGALRSVKSLLPHGKSRHNLAMIEKEKVLERRSPDDHHFEDRFVMLAMDRIAAAQGCSSRKLLENRALYLEDDGELVRLSKGTTIVYRPETGLVVAFTRPPPQ